MIYKQCVLTIANNTAILDEDVYLYRLDKNVELYFTIVNNKYKFDKSDLNNIISMTNASYFQMRLYKNEEVKYTFAIQPTDEGKAKLTITDDLIDEPIEVGDYDFQISLLDADKSSMISMPIARQQLHVCEPLVDITNEAGSAVLGLSQLDTTGEIVDAFDENGNYIRKVHVNGEIISAELFNKWETALETNTKNISLVKNNQINLIEDDTSMEGISDSEHDNLETTNKTIIGGINELDSKFKEIMPVKNTYYFVKNIVPQLVDGKYIINKSSIVLPQDITIGDNTINTLKSRYATLNIDVEYIRDGSTISESFVLKSSYSGYYYSDDSTFLVSVDPSDSNNNDITVDVSYNTTSDEPKKVSLEVKKVSLYYVSFTNLIPDKLINDVDYSKLNNVPQRIKDVEENKVAMLSIKDFASLKYPLDLTQFDLNVTLPNETCNVTPKNHFNDSGILYINNFESNGYRGIKLEDYYSNGYCIRICINDASDVIVKIVEHSYFYETYDVSYTNLKSDGTLEKNIEWYKPYGPSGKTDVYVLFAKKDGAQYGEVNTFCIFKNNEFFTPKDENLISLTPSNNIVTLKTTPHQTISVSEDTEIKLPTVTNYTEIHLFFNTTKDVTLILPSCKWQNGNTPTISVNKTYEFIFTYTTEWLGGVIIYE